MIGECVLHPFSCGDLTTDAAQVVFYASALEFSDERDLPFSAGTAGYSSFGRRMLGFAVFVIQSTEFVMPMILEVYRQPAELPVFPCGNLALFVLPYDFIEIVGVVHTSLQELRRREDEVPRASEPMTYLQFLHGNLDRDFVGRIFTVLEVILRDVDAPDCLA